MSVLLQGLGLCLVFVGAVLIYGAFQGLSAPFSSYQMLGAMIASVPGFTTIGSGLLFWAIGEGLQRLGEISKASRESAAALRAILDREPGQ